MQLVKPESLGFSSPRLARIAPVMQQYVDQKKFPGVLTLVARHGQVVHLDKFGWMDVEAQKPIQFDTIFRIYSMSKPITSVALMMLYEEARFQLNDPVTRWIPEFGQMKVMVNPTGTILADPLRPITIHDLMTHTAGLSYGFDPNPLDEMYRKQLWSMMDKKAVYFPEFIQELTKLPLAFQPGTSYRYSLATDVLGYLVELISGMPFDAFVKEKICAPLGMIDTDYFVPKQKLERFASNYEPAPEGGLKLVDAPAKSHYRKLNGFASGGGGMVSTAADYLRFARMMANYGELDGVRLLGRKTVELMTMNHLPAGVYPFDEHHSGFGLGVGMLTDLAGGQRVDSVGNYGWSGAATTHFWIDPQEDMIAILMTQLMNNPNYPILQDFHVLVNQALVD